MGLGLGLGFVLLRLRRRERLAYALMLAPVAGRGRCAREEGGRCLEAMAHARERLG